MERMLIITLVNAAALWAAAGVVGGIELSSNLPAVLLVGALFGIVNAVIKPIAIFLSLPALLLTVGVFLLVVNATMLAITAALSGSLSVDGFGSALLGAIVISFVSWAISAFLPEDKRPNRPKTRVIPPQSQD